MAIVIPYGDGQAHGSISDSISFRRGRGKVILQKKPFGKQPNSIGQIAQRTKFKDGWNAYHQLNVWEMYYLQDKAVELGTTPANLFLSQYLQDEIPSKIPLNTLKSIIDLSLPVPISTIFKNIRNEFTSKIDSPEELLVMGTIYDKENILIPGSDKEVYNRLLLDITLQGGEAQTIPFNYPVIVKWLNMADEEKINLIRLPEIILPGGGVPSTTPKTNLKRITELEIISPIGTTEFQFGIVYKSKVDSDGELYINADIDDNENVINTGEDSPAHDREYIQIEDNEDTLTHIPDGYQLRIRYLDFDDAPHEKILTLPELDTINGGIPSKAFATRLKEVLSMKVPKLKGLSEQYIKHTIAGAEEARDGGNTFDTENIFYLDAIMDANNTIMGHLRRPNLPDITLPKNYRLEFTVKNTAGTINKYRIFYPAITLNTLSPLYFRVANNGSIWDVSEGTNLIQKHRNNIKKLYIADDWSLYWDEAMTQLAKEGEGGLHRLYVATDFSVYYDQAMTQLANTPYF